MDIFEVAERVGIPYGTFGSGAIRFKYKSSNDTEYIMWLSNDFFDNYRLKKLDNLTEERLVVYNEDY